VAGAAQLQLCTLTPQDSPCEADSATSTFYFIPPSFSYLAQSFAFLCEDPPISDTTQLILFLGSCANRIYSRSLSFDQTNLTIPT
jgi:hypothetical protein